jgi:hypothetical protein
MTRESVAGGIEGGYEEYEEVEGGEEGEEDMGTWEHRIGAGAGTSGGTVGDSGGSGGDGFWNVDDSMSIDWVEGE